MKSVCVYCGSAVGTKPAYEIKAREMGYELARRNLKLVYGAGSVGLMGVIADAVLERQGYVIGVIPKILSTKELQHKRLNETIVTEDIS